MSIRYYHKFSFRCSALLRHGCRYLVYSLLFVPAHAFAQVGPDTLSTPIDEATSVEVSKHNYGSEKEDDDKIVVRTVSFRPQDVQVQDRFRPTAKDSLFPSQWWRRFYLGAGGGIMALSDNSGSVGNGYFTAYLGYKFTPIHSLRMHGSYTTLDFNSGKSSAKSASLGLDYVANITNFAWGYDPSRILDVSTIVGGGVRVNSMGLPHKVTPYAHFGLHADVHLSSNFSLFMEPYVGMHRNMDVLFSRPSCEKWNLMYGMSGGLQMNLNKRDNRYALSDSIYHQFFFDTSIGVAINGRAGGLSHRVGHVYSGALGLWLNPMLGLRLGAQAQSILWSSGMTSVNGVAVRRSLNQALVSGRLELMVNPFNFFRSWRNTPGGHDFDLNLLAGGEYGGNIKSGYPNGSSGYFRCFYYGFTGALQAMYRISKPGTYIFIEPRYMAAFYDAPRQDYGGMERKMEHNLSMNVGTRIYMNRYAYPENNADEFVSHWWAGLDFGGVKQQRSQRLSTGGAGFNPTVGFSLGYDWTRYATLRLQLAYQRLHDTHTSSYAGYDTNGRLRRGYGLWNSAYDDLDVRLTYMLNLNNVFQGYNPNRRFNLWLNAGPTFTYIFNQSDKWAKKQNGKLPQMSRLVLSDHREGKASHGMVASLMATLRVLPSLDVSTEMLGQYNFLAGTNPGCNGRLNNLKYGFTIGTRYHFDQEKFYDFFNGTESKPWQKGWELTASYGWTEPLGTKLGLRASGCNMAVGAGYWFNSLLGARLGVVGHQSYYRKETVPAVFLPGIGIQLHAPYSIYYSQFVLGARAEVMLNPLNLIRSRRNMEAAPRWDMTMSAGLNFGAVGRSGNGISSGYAGFTTSAALLYRLSDEVQLYIEPRYDVNSYGRHNDVLNCKESIHDRFFTISLGTRITRPMGESRESKLETTPADMAHRGMWLGGSIGGAKMMQMARVADGATVQPTFSLATGYDLSRLHGFSFKMNYDLQSRMRPNQPYQVMAYGMPKRCSGTMKSTFHQLDMQLLYMLNISNLWTGYDRRNAFNVYFEAGPVFSTIVGQGNSLVKGEAVMGMDFRYMGKDYSGKCSGGLASGILMAMPVNRHWDITAEVVGRYYFNRTYMPEYVGRFINGIKINFGVGTRYNF